MAEPPPDPPDSGPALPDIGLSDRLAGSGGLDRLVETARGYAAQATAAATRRAYAADWARRRRAALR